MTSKPALNDAKMGRVALGLLPFVLVIVALAAAKPWLKTTIGGPMFTLVVAAVTHLGHGLRQLFVLPLPPRAGRGTQGER